MKHHWLRAMGGAQLPTYSFDLIVYSWDLTFTYVTADAVNFDIDWGDGGSDLGVTANSVAHTYSTPGTYRATIATANPFRQGYHGFPASVQYAGNIEVTGAFPWRPSFASAWRSLKNYTPFPVIDLSVGTDFTTTWSNNESLTSFPLLDLRNSTNFNASWFGCIGLVDFPAGFFDNWVATPVSGCLDNTWLNCDSLSATSVENILNSIDASGQTAPSANDPIDIAYDVATGTPSIATAVANLNARNWQVNINGVTQ